MKQQMFMYVLYVTHLFQDSTFDLLLFLPIFEFLNSGLAYLRVRLIRQWLRYSTHACWIQDDYSQLSTTHLIGYLPCSYNNY